MSPLETLKYRCGDCDDFSILGGYMFEINGVNVKFATISDNTYYPDGLNHAFLWIKIVDYLSQEPWWATNNHWSFNGSVSYDWIIVDCTPGWQSSIWDRPAWYQWYKDNSITTADWYQFVATVTVDP